MSLPPPEEKPIFMKFCIPWVVFSCVTAILVGVLGNSWWTIVIVPLLFCFVCQSSVSSYNHRITARDRVNLTPTTHEGQVSPSTTPANPPTLMFGSNPASHEDLTAQTTITTQHAAGTQKKVTTSTQIPTSLVRFCPACGTRVERGTVCENCGSRLDS
jgi:hypothetical protein